MIKITIFYPNGEGKRFDVEYYSRTHMPMAQALMGPACKGFAVEHGVSGGAPGAPAPYIALGHLYFDTVGDFQAAMGPVLEQLQADMPNYTDIVPSFQLSEVVAI